MKDKTRVLSIVGLYHALTDGTISVIALLFPVFKIVFDLSYTQVGIITGGGLFITLVAQLIIGRLADGKHVVLWLSVGVFLTSIALFILTGISGFLSLMLMIFFIRFATSFFHPIGVGWISRVFKKERLDWAMGVQSGSANFGAFIATATTLYLVELYDLNTPLIIWGCAGLMAGVLALSIMSKLDRSLIVVQTKNMKQTFSQAFDEAKALVKKIQIIAPGFILSGAGWGLMITYAPLLLQERTPASLGMIGVIVAVWIGIGSIISVSYGRISSYLGRRRVIVLAYLGLGIMSVFLSLTTNLIIILGIMVLLGVSLFLTYPALFSYVSEVTPESIESRTFGIIFTLQTGGGTVYLFFGGVISDVVGVWSPFVVYGILCLLLFVLLIINYKKPYVKSD